MPKLPGRKYLRGPVASRLRTKAGSYSVGKSYRSTGVHHVRCSPVSRKRAARRIFTNRTGLKSPTYRSKSQETNAENDCDGMCRQHKTARRRHTGVDSDEELFRLEPSLKARRNRATASRRLNSSLIQLVKFRPTRRDSDEGKRIGHRSKSRQPRRRRRRKCLRNKRSSRRRRSTKRSRVARKSRRSLKRRGGRKMTRQRRRRRKVGQSSRQTKARRIRRYRKSEQRERKRKDVNPVLSPSRERDCMISAHGQVAPGKSNEDRDEYKEDPLNVKDLCRKLVKNMHGVPADSRDYDSTANKKDDRPELQRERDNGSRREQKKAKKSRRRNRKPEESSNRRRKSRNARNKRGRRKVGRNEKPPTIRRRRMKLSIVQVGRRGVNKMARQAGCRSTGRHDPKLTFRSLSCRHHHNHTSSLLRKPTTSRHHGRCQHHRHGHHATGRSLVLSKQRRKRRADRSKKPRNSNNSGRRNRNRNRNNKNYNQAPPSRWLRINGRLRRVSVYIYKQLKGWLSWT